MITLQLTDVSGSQPTASYDILADGKHVGMCQLRRRPSKSAVMPEGFENHIYYEIDLPHRGKGYAIAALRLLCAEAKKSGLDEVRLTIHDDNPASQKVATACGAVPFLHGVDAEGKPVGLYRIML